MPPQIWGFSDEQGFRRCRESIYVTERSVGTNRVPRPVPPTDFDNDVIGVYNGEASNDCPAFGIMLTNGNQSINGWYFDKGKRPDTYGCQTNFLVADSVGVKHSASGAAQGGRGGRYIVAYDNSDGTPSAGDRWGPRSGTFLAKKDTGGFAVIAVVDSTNHWMLCYSEPMWSVKGKPNADILTDASGTLNIYIGTDGSETQANGSPTMTVWNGSSCTIKSAKMAEAAYFGSTQTFRFSSGHTS